MPFQVFLTAEWRRLAMLNYECPPQLLAPFVPHGTELDLFEGRAYASIVAFLFLDTRIIGAPIPFHRDFEEVNLRFYVRRETPQGWRRGVVFIQELVPRAAIAWAARTFYNERYSVAKMSHSIVTSGGEVDVRFDWRYRGSDNSLELKAMPNPSKLVEGSFNQFIAEHYFGYAQQRNGGAIEYAVEHEPWRVHHVTSCSLNADFETLYGPDFSPVLKKEPASVFLAEGSPVRVSVGRSTGRR